MHEVKIDRDHKLIDVHLSGFLSPTDADALAADVRDSIQRLNAGRGEHVTLYDVAKVLIAPGVTIALLQGIFSDPSFRPFMAKRVAFVTRSALGRLQLQRICEGRDHFGIFDDRDSALEFLLATVPVSGQA